MDAEHLTEREFWEIIDSIATENKDNLLTKNHFESLLRALSRLTDNQLKGFKLIDSSLKYIAETSVNSEAVYIVCNGCGDDDFSIFLSGLIALGKRTFYSFLESPEATLLELNELPKLVKCEAFFDQLADRVYEKRVGNEIEELYIGNQLLCEPNDAMKDYTEDPVKLKQKFPRLFKKYWQPDI